jgi:tripartite-type tricarboxylate transporter receptor subunit TctC
MSGNRFAAGRRKELLDCLRSVSAAVLAFTVTASVAHAQAWPAKPVRMIVPAPAGSSLDVIARALGEKLRVAWKQPVIVENKAGAGGMIGMDTVAKAPADGYTIGIGFNGPIAFGPFMYKKMPYSPTEDLAPIVLTTSQPNVLAVQADNPARNLPEFVAWAKSQGDKFTYASVGNGSSSHLTMELFRLAAGFSAVHVPYSGSPPASLSVAAGDTQALFAVAPALLPLIESKRIKLLAVTSGQRDELMKDLPTVAESGYPDFEALAWNGLFAAAATPVDIVARINQDVNIALKDSEVRDHLNRQGLALGGGSAAEFKEFIAKETRKWGEIITTVGIKTE